MIVKTYKELISYIEESMTQGIVELHFSIDAAIAYSFHEHYFMEEEKYRFENLITITKCINLMVENKISVNDGSFKIFNKYVGLVDDKAYLASQLDAEEVLLLEKDVQRVKDYLDSLYTDKQN